MVASFLVHTQAQARPEIFGHGPRWERILFSDVKIFILLILFHLKHSRNSYPLFCGGLSRPNHLNRKVKAAPSLVVEVNFQFLYDKVKEEDEQNAEEEDTHVHKNTYECVFHMRRAEGKMKTKEEEETK